MFSGTFSNDSDNLTQVVFPTSFSNGVKKITEAISTIEIGRATIDTMIYTIVTVIGILIISSLAAYEFAFFRFPRPRKLMDADSSVADIVSVRYNNIGLQPHCDRLLSFNFHFKMGIS